MNIEYRTNKCLRLATEEAFTDGFDREVVRSFRKKIWIITHATDVRDLYRLAGLRLEKLKGKRSHQHSIRLNKKWRMIIEIEKRDPETVVVVVSIEDYH